MSKKILDYLVEENEFPIIFIGSGISKRYLNGYPSWIELLESLWYESKQEGNFYGYLSKVRDELSQGRDVPEYILDYEVNIRVATELERAINGMFSDDEIAIDGINHKQVYEEKLSPFKSLICNKFKSYTILDEMQEEYKLFKEMINKAQILMTTNYDSFIEDSYNEMSKVPVKTYVGQRGFFEQTTGFAELYKIHGCSSESNSIIITERDYNKFDKDSVLISAKIISMLLNSPVIFIGYSLKDRNIRTIIKDFTSSLTNEELIRLEKRLIVIEWQENEEKIIEGIENDPELGCRFTTIRTNNYSEIYSKIQKINQGVSPAEIRRYQHVIKKLIVERGKEGALETVLLSPSQLNEADDISNQKKLVVAIGDSTLVFIMPTLITYIYDYIANKQQQDIETILRFIATQQGRIPFIKYVTEENIENANLSNREKEKLRKRIKDYTDINEQKDSIKTYYRNKYSITDIQNLELKEYMEYSTISFNIDNLNLDEVKDYILNKLEILKKNNQPLKSELRKLILIYDLKRNYKNEKYKG